MNGAFGEGEKIPKYACYTSSAGGPKEFGQGDCAVCGEDKVCLEGEKFLFYRSSGLVFRGVGDDNLGVCSDVGTEFGSNS